MINNKATKYSIYAAIAPLILCLTTNVLGGTYYVDFAAGNDNNPGDSTSLPWRTIPGTRTLSGTAWLRADYGRGAVSSSSKLPFGTVIKLKRGTTYNASLGGFIWIDKYFYADGATATNAVVIQAAEAWGTGPVTFDAIGIPTAVTLFQVQLDGLTIDGKTTGGIVLKNCAIGGLTVKEKAGTGEPVDKCTLVNLKFFNNGWSFLTDKAGAGSGQLSARKAIDLRIENVVLDGDQNFVNGIILGDNHMAVVNAVVQNCESFNHKGDLANNDSGIGFKAFNSQILFMGDRSHDNLKGFDLGEQSGDNVNITYTLLNCTTYSNCWGANMNCTGTAAYTGLVNYYVINTLLYNNSVEGINAYSGPFNLHVVHSVFANNGGNPGTGKGSGHLRVTPDDRADAGAIRAHLYNNIYYKAYYTALTTSWFERATNTFTLDSDYNGYVRGGTELFCRWALYQASECRDFAFGANGPGRPLGQWSTFYGNNAVPPFTPGTGHFGSDTHSKGTGAEDPTLPQFMNPGANDFRLVVNYPGANLQAQPWYIPAMGFDRNGAARVGWDMGVFDSGGGAFHN